MAPDTLTLLPIGPPQPDPSGLRRFYEAAEVDKQVFRSSKTPIEPEQPIVRPSINFEPNRVDYESRTRRILENKRLDTSLPDGFPGEIVGDRVWDGRTIGGVEALIIALRGDDIEEIESALRYFKGGLWFAFPLLTSLTSGRGHRSSGTERTRTAGEGPISSPKPGCKA